jgi:hypothetical protein
MEKPKRSIERRKEGCPSDFCKRGRQPKEKEIG